MADDGNTVEDVLVITGGLVPALVTETLYGLALEYQTPRARDPFWPKRVIVAGTSANQKQCEEQDLEARIADLCGQILLPAPGLTFETTNAYEDIRPPAGAEAFGDLMVRLLRGLTGDPAIRLHVSLAGGRKSMSFHAGAVLSLYGRPCDTLSHVLLDPPTAEQARNFWFPTLHDHWLRGERPDRTPYELMLHGERLNAKDVEVLPVSIPYLSVRDYLPESLKTRDFSFAEVIELGRIALNPDSLRLILNANDFMVIVPGVANIRLPAAPFAVYMLLAEWAKHQRPGAGKLGEGPAYSGWLSNNMLGLPEHCIVNPVGRFLDIYQTISAPLSTRLDERSTAPFANSNSGIGRAALEAHRRTIKRRAAKTVGELNTRFFGPKRSALLTSFQGIATEAVRSRLLSVVDDSDDGLRFGIDVPPEQIELIWPAPAATDASLRLP